jgi:hypothetical protein
VPTKIQTTWLCLHMSFKGCMLYTDILNTRTILKFWSSQSRKRCRFNQKNCNVVWTNTKIIITITETVSSLSLQYCFKPSNWNFIKHLCTLFPSTHCSIYKETFSFYEDTKYVQGHAIYFNACMLWSGQNLYNQR